MKKAIPFFVRFLESNECENLNEVRGGLTLKYPSDNDEIIFSDDLRLASKATRKYPSDKDEIDML